MCCSGKEKGWAQILTVLIAPTMAEEGALNAPKYIILSNRKKITCDGFL